MSNKWTITAIFITILVLWGVVTAGAGPPAQSSQAVAEPLGTSFTYQGHLELDGEPVDDLCDFQFSLYDDDLGATQIGVTQTVAGLDVIAGSFTAQLDFGADPFRGDARWLGIQVQCTGEAEYANLGIQALTATPYALYALAAPWDGLTGLPAGFADGVDDVAAVVSGTALYAGEGLNRVGSGSAITMSLAPSYRLPQTCAGGQIAEWDGAAWVCGDDDTGGGGGDAWSLTGNAGTDPASHYLGTRDGMSLTLAVSGTPALRLAPTGETPNLIGGSVYNVATVGVEGAVIGGGGKSSGPNQALADYVTIGGGYANAASNYNDTIGGGNHNAASGGYTAIGGGQFNTASGVGATVSGGGLNTASGYAATAGGGWGNVITASYATVGGGSDNVASGPGAFIGGGGYDGVTYDGNEAYGDASTIGGGQGNLISTTADYATIGGGQGNVISTTIAAYNADYATIGGGIGNVITGTATYAADYGGTIGGGGENTACGPWSTIGGGLYNTTIGRSATVGGGENNEATGWYTTVGGGEFNEANESYSTVGGGRDNEAVFDYDTVGGGWRNSASGRFSTVGGGNENTASGMRAAVSGGARNIASGSDATIGGGDSNTASGMRATVGGGWDNTASGDYATVPGGRHNVASGADSFAAGRRAQALHDGSIILADSNNFDFASIMPDTFRVRATGGIRFVLGIDGSGNMTWSCLVNDGNSWSCSSDRNLKENLNLVDGGEILRRLARMPVYTWNGKGQDPALRHMGPMAQDFYAAFGLGGDDTHIATIDLDGVALAAIQGLHAQNQGLQADNDALKAENAAQQEQIDDLEARLSALERAGSSGAGLPSAGLPSTYYLSGVGLLLVGGVGLGWFRRNRASNS